jgi:hypothetical protein
MKAFEDAKAKAKAKEARARAREDEAKREAKAKAKRVFANPLGGVRRDLPGSPALPPLAEGEMEVLSHVLSPEVTRLYKEVRALLAARGNETSMEIPPARILSPVDEGDDYHRLKGMQAHKQVTTRVAKAMRAEVAASVETLTNDVSRSEPARSEWDLPRELAYSSDVEMFTVKKYDRRVALRGQLGVRCKKDKRAAIPARTILGPYAAYVCTEAEHAVRKFRPPPGSGSGSGGARGDAATPVEALEEELNHLMFETMFDNTRGTEVGGVKMLVDAYGYGGFAAAVNDPTIDPSDSPERIAEPNVALVEVLVHGFPFMMHVSLRAIEPGEELLCCYGQGYWDAHAEARVRIEHMKKSWESLGVDEKLRARAPPEETRANGSAGGGGKKAGVAKDVVAESKHAAAAARGDSAETTTTTKKKKKKKKKKKPGEIVCVDLSSDDDENENAAPASATEAARARARAAAKRAMSESASKPKPKPKPSTTPGLIDSSSIDDDAEPIIMDWREVPKPKSKPPPPPKTVTTTTIVTETDFFEPTQIGFSARRAAQKRLHAETEAAMALGKSGSTTEKKKPQSNPYLNITAEDVDEVKRLKNEKAAQRMTALHEATANKRARVAPLSGAGGAPSATVMEVPPPPGSTTGTGTGAVGAVPPPEPRRSPARDANTVEFIGEVPPPPTRARPVFAPPPQPLTTVPPAPPLCSRSDFIGILDDADFIAHAARELATIAARRADPDEVRSIHWFPYDRVHVVDADP